MTKFGGFGKRPFGSSGSPNTEERSSTWTRSPARAKNTAAVKPLCPAPKHRHRTRSPCLQANEMDFKEHGPAEARPRPFFLKSALLDSNQ